MTHEPIYTLKVPSPSANRCSPNPNQLQIQELKMDQTLLRVFDLAKYKDVRVNAAITRCRYIRCILAGFIGIAQILSMSTMIANIDVRYKEDIARGKAPAFVGANQTNGERGLVVRFCGEGSDTTVQSIRRFGSHILPIFENPDLHAVVSLLKHHSEDKTKPVYWQIGDGRYSNAAEWGANTAKKGDLATADFQVHREWFVPVAKGTPSGEALIVEADICGGTMGEALTNTNNDDDLSIQEAGQGFSMIRKLATAQGVLDETRDSYIRIVIGNALQQIDGGDGGEPFDLRSYIKAMGSCDVFIDTGKSTVKALLLNWTDEWIERNNGARSSAPVVFDTFDRNIFQSVQEILWAEGWSTVGKRALVEQHNCHKPMGDSPVIIYDESGSASIYRAQMLIRHGKIKGRNICVLLDSISGVEELQELNRNLPDDQQVNHICAAEVNDQLLQEARLMVRRGLPPEQIQTAMDQMISRGGFFQRCFRRFEDLHDLHEQHGALSVLPTEQKLELRVENRQRGLAEEPGTQPPAQPAPPSGGYGVAKLGVAFAVSFAATSAALVKLV